MNIKDNKKLVVIAAIVLVLAIGVISTIGIGRIQESQVAFQTEVEEQQATEDIIEEPLQELGEEEGESAGDKNSTKKLDQEKLAGETSSISTEESNEDSSPNNGVTYPTESEEKRDAEQSATNNRPITTEQYTVQAGDSLFLIAQRAKVSLDHLRRLNQLSGDRIMVGQVLQIVGEAPPSAPVNVATRGTERDEDLYWLSRIIHAEAQGEPYEGKVAVGNVILNRVRDRNFPNTIYGVVFDRQYGYTQFSPVLDGSINNTPNADSIRAAKDALNGVRPVGDALYFLNPRKATNFWIVQNRKFFMTIGDHDFYH